MQVMDLVITLKEISFTYFREFREFREFWTPFGVLFISAQNPFLTLNMGMGKALYMAENSSAGWERGKIL